MHATEDATVGTVAALLGLDHSGASRLVRDAVAAGHLTRTTSAHDRRQLARYLECLADQLGV